MFHKFATTGSMLAAGLMILFGTAHPGRVRAQNPGEPNLSGTWELIDNNFDKKSRGDARFPQLTLVISHEGSELRIIRKRIRRTRDRKVNGTEDVREFTYHTDGRRDTNLGRFELWSTSPEFTTVTRLVEDNRILTENTENRGYFKEEWSLKEAGNRLQLITMVVDHSAYPLTPAGTAGRRKWVFRKVS